MVLVSAAGAWWLSSATPLLQRLKGSQTLEHLYIESTRLSLEDYQLIGTLKNLTVLKTRGCGGNDQDIAAVSDLDKLKEFDLSENAVTVAVAPSLNKLHAHGLKTVKTLSSFLPGEEHDKLRRACPGLLFP
jgi:hypothetical protein